MKRALLLLLVARASADELPAYLRDSYQTDQRGRVTSSTHLTVGGSPVKPPIGEQPIVATDPDHPRVLLETDRARLALDVDARTLGTVSVGGSISPSGQIGPMDAHMDLDDGTPVSVDAWGHGSVDFEGVRVSGTYAGKTTHIFTSRSVARPDSTVLVASPTLRDAPTGRAFATLAGDREGVVLAGFDTAKLVSLSTYTGVIVGWIDGANIEGPADGEEGGVAGGIGGLDFPPHGPTVPHGARLRAKPGGEVVGVLTADEPTFTPAGPGWTQVSELGIALYTDATPIVAPPILPPPPPPPPPPASQHLIPATILESLRTSGDPAIHLPADMLKSFAKAGTNRVIVVVKICLDDQGAPTSTTVIKGSGLAAADAFVLDAMRAWRFRPFSVNGTPAPVCTAVVFQYQLQ